MLLCDLVCVLVRKWEVSPRNGGGEGETRTGEEESAVGETLQEDRGWTPGQILEKTNGV